MENGQDYIVMFEDENRDRDNPQMLKGSLADENTTYVTIEDDNGKLWFIPWCRIYYITPRGKE